ncbi:hypothetical protein GCM10011584_18770 [Nocardioides phosphati]|uniref:ARB-07466-like C-terminal domain-containing protein n=1 Tax=Nocardioides phosphati TaxID=1867775 RepID=A0ABQ2NBZ2_9ACTN|nr:hypothetical protein [Nocardioides phosphati]GGO89427.1 hypothetical protein GCM10011584_18770 [Nocardioides phosphati]
MRVRSAVATLAVLAGVGGVAVAVVRGAGPLPDPEGCTAVVQQHEVLLDTEQAENAALIAAIGVHRSLPARAVSIALATAYQESKMVNIEHGDRDSLGLFQQRPSQGWGTESEILDPVHATNAFYDALVKIDGYESMRITEAAQKVQHSAFPEAYEDHAEDGRALASALTGWSHHSFTCVVRHGDGDVPGTVATVRQEVANLFGLTGTRSGRRGLDLAVGGRSPADLRRGWAIASYLVAQANRLGIGEVRYDGKVWRSGDASEDGWRDATGSAISGPLHVEIAR